MLKTESSEENVMSDCKVSRRQSGYRFGLTKSRDATGTGAATAVASKYYEDIYFENRKRRPQERGRKKRRKGKWNPIDRLWNSGNHKECSPMYLFKQD